MNYNLTEIYCLTGRCRVGSGVAWRGRVVPPPRAAQSEGRQNAQKMNILEKKKNYFPLQTDVKLLNQIKETKSL